MSIVANFKNSDGDKTCLNAKPIAINGISKVDKKRYIHIIKIKDNISFQYQQEFW